MMLDGTDKIPMLGFPEEQTLDENIYTCVPVPRVRIFVWQANGHSPVTVEAMQVRRDLKKSELYYYWLNTAAAIREEGVEDDVLAVAAAIERAIKKYKSRYRRKRDTRVTQRSKVKRYGA